MKYLEKTREGYEWTSPFDGKRFAIKPEHGTISYWNEGRCWSVSCENSIVYVRISKKGYWQLGYCSDTYGMHKYCELFGGRNDVSKWYLALNGKLQLDKWPSPRREP